MTFKHFITVISAMFLTPLMASENIQALDDVEHAVYMHALMDAQTTYNNPRVIVDPIDNRLRLAACDQKFQTFANTSANTLGKRTIGVRCTSPEVWTLYVPVTVKVMKPVVVAKRTLPTDHILQKQDLMIQLMDVSQIRQGYFESYEQVISRQMRYTLGVGKVISPSSMRQVDLVRRGEQVTIIASAGTMEVRVKGTALDDGSMGQSVRVKNNTSKRVIEGVVHRTGVVKVAM